MKTIIKSLLLFAFFAIIGTGCKSNEEPLDLPYSYEYKTFKKDELLPWTTGYYSTEKIPIAIDWRTERQFEIFIYVDGQPWTRFMYESNRIDKQFTNVWVIELPHKNDYTITIKYRYTS